jgi:hypothetical protein
MRKFAPKKKNLHTQPTQHPEIFHLGLTSKFGHIEVLPSVGLTKPVLTDVKLKGLYVIEHTAESTAFAIFMSKKSTETTTQFPSPNLTSTLFPTTKKVAKFHYETNFIYSGLHY